MFTGLVQDTGEIAAVRADAGGRVLAVRTGLPLAQVAIGDSIAVDGVCLTVETLEGDTFTATAGPETLSLTTLGGFRAGRRVHLEQALALGERLGGHLVQGHVDCTGTVTSASRQGDAQVIWIEAPAHDARYIAAKGSICVDGVSLTVNEVQGRRFRVNIVPHTLQVTRMGDYRPGDAVNLEVDILAKYVERLLSTAEPGKGLTLDTLRKNGFG